MLVTRLFDLALLFVCFVWCPAYMCVVCCAVVWFALFCCFVAVLVVVMCLMCVLCCVCSCLFVDVALGFGRFFACCSFV